MADISHGKVIDPRGTHKRLRKQNSKIYQIQVGNSNISNKKMHL